MHLWYTYTDDTVRWYNIDFFGIFDGIWGKLLKKDGQDHVLPLSRCAIMYNSANVNISGMSSAPAKWYGDGGCVTVRIGTQEFLRSAQIEFLMEVQ